MISVSVRSSLKGVILMLEEISEALQDGGWHGEEEIAEALNLSPELVRKVVRFLAKYGLVESRVFAEKKFRWLKDAPGLAEALMIVRAVSLEPMQTCSAIALKLEIRR